MTSPLSFFTLDEIISQRTHASVFEALGRVEFRDGAETAGHWEGHRKHNTQAAPEALRPVFKDVMRDIMTDRRLCNRTFPHEAVQPMLNRYRVGDYYGAHEDSPIQSGIRADLSYTLFLNDPTDYEGGELVLGSGDAAARIKLPARALVCYPSGTLHQVTPVTAGERLAMVGWMRSIVRDPADRHLLWELRETIDALTERDGVEDEVATLSRIYGGLMRRWAFG